MSRQRRGTWVVVLSLFVALVLAVVPLPDWLDWLRPHFPLLVLVYWCAALPARYGTWTGLLLGLVLDVLRGQPLGLNAAVLAVAGFAAGHLGARLKVYPMAQQAMVVGLLTGATLVLGRLLGNMAGTTTMALLPSLLPLVTTALLWPWALAVLDRLRRRFAVG